MLTLEPGTKPTDDILRTEVPRLFPESIETLHVTWRTLGTDVKGTRIGFSAVRKDVLKQYEDICIQAGIHVRETTTAPAAIASAEKSTAETFVLVMKTSDDAEGTASLVHHGYIVDEAILPGDATDASLANAAHSLVHEYAVKGFSISSMLVVGSKTLLKAVRSIRGENNSAASVASSRSVSALESPKNDLEWMGIFHSLTAVPQTVLDFSRQTTTVTRSSAFLISVPVIAVLLLLVGYSQRSQFSASVLPLDVASEQASSERAPVEHAAADPETAAAQTWSQQKNILTEINATAFLAAALVSRQDFLRAVLRLAPPVASAKNLPPSGFTDIDLYPDLPPLVRYAKDKGMVSAGKEFFPDRAVTLSAALKMAYVGLGVIDPKGITAEPWYAPYRERALKDGILTDPSVSMDGDLPRDAAILILWKLSQK